jgi:hypothetical protein
MNIEASFTRNLVKIYAFSFVIFHVAMISCQKIKNITKKVVLVLFICAYNFFNILVSTVINNCHCDIFWF